MDPRAGKGTPKDLQAIESLLPMVAEAGVERTSLYKILSKAKFNPSWWRSLSAEDCLIYDLKSQGVLAIPSVLLSLRELLEKEDSAAAIHKFLNQRPSTNVIVIMSLVSEPEPHRELALLTRLSCPEDHVKARESFCEAMVLGRESGLGE